MSTKLIAVIVAVVLVVGGLLFLLRGNGVKTAVAAPAKPWIEVIAAPVFERDSATQKENIRELFTGDELTAGLVIGVPENSLAALHFPDGSVARLDSDTALVVIEASFSDDTNTLAVSLKLSWGRVWSKIFELATPQSHWEVKTTNAVAVVRGTAFGVEYVGTASSIVGGAHSVSIAAVDPDTGETIAESETQVAENQFLHIEKKDIPAIKSGRISLARAVTAPPKDVEEAGWVMRAKEEDRRFDEQVEALRERVREETAQARAESSLSAPDEKGALRKALQTEIKKEFDIVRKNREERRKQQEEKQETVNKEEEQKTQQTGERETKPAVSEVIQTIEKAVSAQKEVLEKKIPTSASIGTPSTTGGVQPKELRIKSPIQEGFRVSEGEPVRLAAVLVMSDGSTRDVTQEAVWRVLGPIGAMKNPGLFVGKLSSAVVELGRAPGTIIASWKDPKSTNNTLLGRTPVFEVEFKVPEGTDERG